MKENLQQAHQNNFLAENHLRISQNHQQQQSEEHFFTTHEGIKKRKVFMSVKYSKEEHEWIKRIHEALKKQKNIELTKKQTLLRYYYSSNLNLETCVEKLAHYYQWFNDEQIQTVSAEAKKLLECGFVYSYGLSKEGRAFIVMNIGNMDFDNFQLKNYYQAINHVNNKVIHQKFIPGKIETYDYILDLNEKFLSLPITSIKQIISTFSDVYSMRMQNMYIVNCTLLAKWIYLGIEKVISQQTSKKIKLFTKDEIEQGVLHEFIDQNELQKKLGGRHPNIIHIEQESCDQSPIEKFNETEYFSIEEQNSMFVGKKDEIPCCGTGECAIF